MKEIIYKLLRKNKKIYFFAHNTYDFVRPKFRKFLKFLNIGFELDRCVERLSKAIKKTKSEDIVFIKGNPYFNINSKLFKYEFNSIEDSSGMFKDKKEFVLKKFILSCLKHDSVFFDIGANIGFFTVFSSEKIRDGKIYSFEPVKKTFSVFMHNIKANSIEPVVDANRVALSDYDGFIYITTNKSGRNHISSKKMHTEKVRKMKIDTFVKLKKIKRVDLIKCDVEGAELFVLRGASKLLDKNKPVLVLEIQDNWTKRFGYSPSDIFEFLRKKAYSYEIATDNGLVKGSNYKNIRRDLSLSNNFVFEKR